MKDVGSSRYEHLGFTMVLYKMEDISEVFLSSIAKYMDVIKFGWTLPLFVDDKYLENLTKLFKKFNLSYMNGGTLFEYYYKIGKIDEFIEFLHVYEFEYVEISRGSIDIPDGDIIKIASNLIDRGFRVMYEAGKKNPYVKVRLGDEINLSKKLKDIGVEYIILEGREIGRNTLIYDEDGYPKWDVIYEFLDECGIEKILVEAPNTWQQAEFIIEIGPEVALGNIKLEDVLPLESLRHGLRGDVFAYREFREKISSPSEKYILYILDRRGPLTISQISRISGLPIRTVREAVKRLRDRGYIFEVDTHGREKIWGAR